MCMGTTCSRHEEDELIKLIAFELAGEDHDRRENPVLSRLKIAFFALQNVVERDFPLGSRILRPAQTQSALNMK